MTTSPAVAWRTTLGAAAVLLVGAGVLFFLSVPRMVDRRMNVREQAPPYAVSAAAESLHRTLVVADLHADPLLWGRDLNERATHGHVDVPRLIEGNVALQVFATVTKTPRGMNYDHNDSTTDNITLLGIAQRWPVATWRSLRARALFLAGRLRDAERHSDGRLTVITTHAELTRFLARRAGDRAMVAGLLATEGLQVLEGRLDNLDTLYRAGFRMVGLAHFFDNEVAASAHGVSHGGLTPLGQQVVRRAERLGMLVDVAHASPRTIDDVLAIATKPVMVSHTGVQATCPGPRNLSDDQLRRIAATGGVIGIGFWNGAVCTPSAKTVAQAIIHAVQVAGVEHVGLGSDFDGATTEPWDASGLALVTQALMDAGMSPGDIALVMGGNVVRVLSQSLPE